MPQLFLPIFPSDVTEINLILAFAKRDGTVYYFHGAAPVYSHRADDLAAFRFITSQLVVNGNATQAEIVRAFGISPISMKRYVKRLREKGPSGFFEKQRKRKATVLTAQVLKEAQNLLNNDCSISEAAEELGIKICTLRKAVNQGRLHRREKKRIRSSIKQK